MEKTKEQRIRQFQDIMNDVLKVPTYTEEVTKSLDEMGFFTAPASTKYHGDYEGGLFDHSLAVTTILTGMTYKLELNWENRRSPFIVGLFHDLCKCDSYIKTEEGFTYNNDKALKGHGDKSVILTQQFMTLTEEEIVCIRYHMGAFIDTEKTDYRDAIQKDSNVLWTHTADMVASQVWRV